MSVVPEEEMVDESPSLTQVAEGPKPTETVAGILRKAYNEAQQNRKPKDIVIPGYGEPESELHVTFQMIDDYEDLREGIRRALNQRGLSQAKREVQLAMETLRAAAVGSYALVNGEKHDLGEPLGLGLYEALGRPGMPDGAEVGVNNDSQAIFMLFHQSTTLIMSAYMELDMWIKRGGHEAEEEALGEF